MIKKIVFFLLACLPVISYEAYVPSQPNPQDYEYLELYRATKGDKMLLVRGTLHTLKPSEDPSLVAREIQGASAIYSENHNNQVEDFAEQFNSQSAGTEQITAKIQKRDGEPNWLDLFKAKKMKDAHGNPTTLYNYLATDAAIKSLLLKMSQDVTFDSLLSSSSAYGIFYAYVDIILMQQMEGQQNAYEKLLFDMFVSSRKPATLMETTEEFLKFKRDATPSNIETIIDNSISAPHEFIDLLVNFIASFNAEYARLLYSFKKGWASLALKNYNPESEFIYGRTCLWFDRYIKTDPFQPPKGSLFCMGAGHLHTLTLKDGSNKHGFLGKLEADGWTLENLKIDGQWKLWTTSAHQAWLNTQEAEIHKQFSQFGN